jgi:hypothetical protein
MGAALALAVTWPASAAAETWTCTYLGFDAKAGQPILVQYDVIGKKMYEHVGPMKVPYDVLENNAVGLVAVDHFSDVTNGSRSLGTFTVVIDRRDGAMVRANTLVSTDDPSFRRGTCVSR